MANTYTLINSTSLSSSAASVTFSAIPATYDDLCLVMSLRQDWTGINNDLLIQFNADTTTKYSFTYIQGDGTSATSSRSSSFSYIEGNIMNADGATSNTFSSHEIYIPKYNSTSSKPLSTVGFGETNATTARLRAQAALYTGGSGITEIKLYNSSTYRFMTNSSFWLYGIKNS